VWLSTGDAGARSGRSLFDFDEYHTITDDQGRFVMSFVAPGEQDFSREWPDRISTRIGSAFVKSGEVTQVSLGGNHTVSGKFRCADPRTLVDWKSADGQICTPLPSVFYKMQALKSPEERSDYCWTNKEFKLSLKTFRGYRLTVSANGSFQAEDVPAGKYEIYISDKKHLDLHGKIVISDGADKDIAAPIDAGVIDLEIVPNPNTTKPASATPKS
jgi:hypothetical protein